MIRVSLFMMYLKYLIVVILLICADQFSKYQIVSKIPLGQRIFYVPDFFALTYVKNTGAGFSILQNATGFLSLVSAVAVIVLVYFLLHENNKLTRVCYLLIISGAIGNLIDRIRLGYVVDFLDCYIFGYDFPVFNVADSFITVGCILLILLNLKGNKDA